MTQLTFQAQHIVKKYGGVTALSDGNLEIHSGEVVALVGANGSGKSTLSKVITGVVNYNQGELIRDGQRVNYPNPISARKAGITAVFQELSLVPEMTVAENIWLTHEPLQRGGWVDEDLIEAQTEDLLSLFSGTFQTSLHAEAIVGELSPDEKQIVEILKAFSLNPEILILDEATASLDSQQVKRLFQLMEEWKSAGMALVFVSHRMDEIFQIGDRAVVLRNGKTVGEVSLDDVTENDIVNLMVGAERGLEDVKSQPPEIQTQEPDPRSPGSELGRPARGPLQGVPGRAAGHRRPARSGPAQPAAGHFRRHPFPGEADPAGAGSSFYSPSGSHA